MIIDNKINGKNIIAEYNKIQETIKSFPKDHVEEYYDGSTRYSLDMVHSEYNTPWDAVDVFISGSFTKDKGSINSIKMNVIKDETISMYEGWTAGRITVTYDKTNQKTENSKETSIIEKKIFVDSIEKVPCLSVKVDEKTGKILDHEYFFSDTNWFSRHLFKPEKPISSFIGSDEIEYINNYDKHIGK